MSMKKLLLLLFLWLPVLACTQKYTGTIIRVIDGDTFVFQTGEGSLTVRMYGIDAPEKNQPYGPESKAFLENYLHKKASLVTKGTDKYGRTLGILLIKGKNINLKMVQTGNAWRYKKNRKDESLIKAENRARKRKLGLWAKPAPVNPYDFRNN
jgi:micrococcal nuclease